MLEVGLIGVGRTADLHADAAAASPHTDVVAVADINEEKGRAFAQAREIAYFRDYEEMVGETDVTVILLPHHLHEAASLAALEADNHLFIEKPMAMTTAECDRILDAAEARDLQIMVGHHYHFNPPTLKVKELLQGRELGRPVLAWSAWFKPFHSEPRPPWMLKAETGGGMWPMNGSHLVDRLMFVTGDDIVAVKAAIGHSIFGYTATDSGIAHLQFSGGFSASIQHAGYRTGVPRFETEYVCTEGMVRETWEQTISGKDERVYVDRDGAYEAVALPAGDTFKDQFLAFAQALVDGGTVPTDGYYGRRVVAVLEATERSSETGREVLLADYDRSSG